MANYIPPISKRDSGPQLFSAEMVADRIQQHITHMQEGLSEADILLAIVPLADGTRIAADFFGFRNPNFIVVGGYDQKGDRVSALIAHTAVQIVLKVVKKESDQRKPVIGFQGTKES